MTPLADLLAKVPAVYAQLGDAAVPMGSAGGDMPTGGTSVHPNAPARLDVIDHRHKLVAGLRWWVDAVRDDAGKPPVGDSPARMCAVLLHYLPDMAAEDMAELRSNLWEWVGDALPMVGQVETPTPPLPVEALDRVVPVHVAAEALGISVSTVKRRATRVGGQVLLRHAAGPPCPQSDLPEAWCAHCRPVRTETAQVAH